MDGRGGERSPGGPLEGVYSGEVGRLVLVSGWIMLHISISSSNLIRKTLYDECPRGCKGV